MLSAPADQPPAGPCRLVAEWDADHDVVAYETRRDDCATPAPPLTGTKPGRRHKSLFELYRISTGKLVDAADCEISYVLGGGEEPCDLATIPQFRKTFARLRTEHRGTPAEVTPDQLWLPGGDAPLVAKLSAFGEAMVTATHTKTHRFVVLAHGTAQLLLRLPYDSAPTGKRQRELLGQA